MEPDRTSPADGCPGHRAGGRSPSHQRHRACTEERLSLNYSRRGYGYPLVSPGQGNQKWRRQGNGGANV